MILRSSAILVLATFALLLGCSNSDGTAGGTNDGGQAAGGDSTGGVSGSSSGGASGTAGSGGTVDTGGTAGSAGESVGGAGGSSTAGSGGDAVGGGGSSATGGTAGDAGAATGGGGSGGDGGVIVPVGPSAGCNMTPPANDSEDNFTLHEIHITETIPPQYLTGGALYENSGNYDFQFRPYSIRLPRGYDPSTPYPVIMAGGGCGGDATGFANNPGSGYDIDKNREAIFVGLSYIRRCFADGGGDTKISGPNGMVQWVDTPEVAYVHEVLAEVKAKYCVNQSKVLITGTSSGGWESITVGCALANEIRVASPVSGGLRLHRPACAGPQASIFVEGLTDGANPIFENPPNGDRDSPGSGPARDEVLVRNGCVASDYMNTIPLPYNNVEDTAGAAPHMPWDAAFPQCVTYTGCPAQYPVVWCALPCGHQCDNEGGRDYKQAMMKFFDALPSQ